MFEKDNLALETIFLFIEKEVAKTTSTGTLFRSNDIPSRMVRFYIKMIGPQYLRTIFAPLIRNMNDSDLSFEVDPSKISSDENIDDNMSNLKHATKQVFDTIMSNMSDCPSQILSLCGFLGRKVREKFPDHYLVAMGGFFFLRYLCPALLQA